MRRQLTLPEHKLCELGLLLRETTAKRSITKRDLQSLVGKLNFAARVVFGGRTFLRRMIDTVNHMQRPHHHVRINAQVRADLEWWREFLGVFNGKTFCVDSEQVPTEEFSTDACPIGGGGFFQGDWFCVNWATNYPRLVNLHINLQETFTVLLALGRWKDQLHDKWIIVRTDNTTTLSAINKGTSSNRLATQAIQYRNRTLLVPVPRIEHSQLCLHKAIVNAFKLLGAHDSDKLRDGPAFVYTSGEWNGTLLQYVYIS